MRGLSTEKKGKQVMFMYITVKKINLNQPTWSELFFVFFDNHIIRFISHIVHM